MFWRRPPGAGAGQQGLAGRSPRVGFGRVGWAQSFFFFVENVGTVQLSVPVRTWGGLGP